MKCEEIKCEKGKWSDWFTETLQYSFIVFTDWQLVHHFFFVSNDVTWIIFLNNRTFFLVSKKKQLILCAQKFLDNDIKFIVSLFFFHGLLRCFIPFNLGWKKIALTFYLLRYIKKSIYFWKALRNVSIKRLSIWTYFIVRKLAVEIILSKPYPLLIFKSRVYGQDNKTVTANMYVKKMQLQSLLKKLKKKRYEERKNKRNCYGFSIVRN